MAKQKLSKEEKKRLRKEQRQKDALRSYRFRGFKNFLFWLSGMLTCLVILVSALFVGLKVIPVGTYLGSGANEYVSKDVSSKSIIDAFLKANTYDMSDFPVVAEALDDYIKSANLDEYVEVDVEKIKSLKFDDSFETELQSCVKVVATLDSFGGAELLRDLGKLDVFNEWAPVDIDNMPIDEDGDGVIDKDGENFKSNPKLYYYLETSSPEPVLLAKKMNSGEGEYVRVFDDNGHYVEGYNGEQLLFANLSKVPVIDILDLIDESFGRLKLTNIINTFAGEGNEIDISLIGDILGDNTISQIQNITADTIKLSSILPYKDAEKGVDNSQLYKIILQACGKKIVGLEDEGIEELAKDLSINSFNNIDFNKVSVQTFELEDETLTHLLNAVNGKIEADNKKIEEENEKKKEEGLKPGEEPTPLKPLLSSTAELTVGHLTSLDTKYITLSSVLSYEENAQLYKIILQACGKNITGLEDADIARLAQELTINDFTKFNEQNVTLNSILPVDKVDDYGNYVNKNLYDILLDMVNAGKPDANKKTATEITISDLSSFKTSNIKLSTILPLTTEINGEIIETNKDLYNILSDVVNAPGATQIVAKEDITIEHLSNNFVYSNIRLNTILKIEYNSELYDILNDIINGDKESGHEGYVAKTDFTIASLSDFSYSKIRLNTVMKKTSANAGLYDILLDVINGESGRLTEKDIMISHLSTFNNFDHVKLSTVLPYEKENESGIVVPANESLYSILLDIVNGDKVPGSEGYITKSGITLAHLSQFNVSKLHLKTVMGSSSNTILSKLIEKNIEIGDLGTAIDGLSLYEIYGKNCFRLATETDDGKARYQYVDNKYVLDANGEYVVSDDAGIWLFLCFDSGGIEIANPDQIGCSQEYTISGATLSMLSDSESGSSISSKITNATIRQLYEAGILESALPELYAMSLQDVANGGSLIG